jgi:hypothetical protein
MLERTLWRKPVLIKRKDGTLATISTAQDAMEAIAPFAAEPTPAFISARDAVVDLVREVIMQDFARRTFVTAIKELGLDVFDE